MKTPSNEEDHQSIEEIGRLTNGLSKTIAEKEDAASKDEKEVQTQEKNEIITSAAQVEKTCQLKEIDLDNNSGQQQKLSEELVPNTGSEQQKKNSDMSQTIPITNGEQDNTSPGSSILTNGTRAIANGDMSPINSIQPAYPIESTIHFTIYDTPLKPVTDDTIKFRKTNSLELTTFGIETVPPSGDNRQSEPIGPRQVDSQIMMEEATTEKDKPKLRKELRNPESNEPEFNNLQPPQFVAHYQCVLGILFIILIVLIIFFVKMFIKNDNSGDNSNTTTIPATSS